MSRRLLAALLWWVTAGAAHAVECARLDPGSAAYQTARAAMSGHFPVELEDIRDCGVHGFSKLFTAKVAPYQTHEGWTKSGSLRCWQSSPRDPEEVYDCRRSIISTFHRSDVRVVSEYEIPLPIIAEATTAVGRMLDDGEAIASLNYVPVPCGGSWSISSHGFLLELAARQPDMRRRFVAKQDCSPTPCLWEIEELEPEYSVYQE